MANRSPTGRRVTLEPSAQGIPVRTPEVAQIRAALTNAPDHANPNREPVITIYDLAKLDDSETSEGYVDGREGMPCGDNRSRSYWHGWRQGSRDHGHRQGDIWDTILTMTVCPKGRGWSDLPARVEAMRKLLDADPKSSVDRGAA